MALLFKHEPPENTPMVCDFNGAPDTPQQRLAEYGRLFQAGPVSPQRTTTAVVLTFSGHQIASWVADLAAREAACCPFMSYLVTQDGDSVRWETSGSPDVQPILDEYYELYHTAATASVEDLIGHLAERGFNINSTTSNRFEHERNTSTS